MKNIDVFLEAVAEERKRQIQVENWSENHDDEHVRGEMAKAAAAYAWLSGLPEQHQVDYHMEKFTRGDISCLMTRLWPVGWTKKWLKPKDKKRNLVRAAALLAAEYERLLRKEMNDA